MCLKGIPKIDYKIIELWEKGHSISDIVSILKTDIEYVKRKVIARKVTDRATKENILEHNRLMEMWKEEEKKLNE